MYLKEIRYVLAIAEAGSLTHAARQLYISQSSLSQFLNEYERQLGFTLFNRLPRGVSLTPDGMEYVQAAKDIARRFDDMLDRLEERKVTSEPHLRLGISEQRGMVVTPILYPLFTRRNPGIRLEITDGNAKELQELVRQRKLNIALCASLQQRNQIVNEVNCRIIMSEEVLLAVPKQHPLVPSIYTDEHTGRRWLEIRQIRTASYVLFDPKRNIRKFSDKLFRENNMQPKVLQTSTNMSTILKICVSENAFAFVPKGLVSYNDDLEYISIGKRGKFWSLILMTAVDRTLTPLENKLINTISDCLIETCK